MAEEEEVDFTKLSIEDRCQHKNWKARVSAYEELTTLFQTITDDKSPEFNKYAPLIKKFVIDSNAAAQEKGLAAVLAFVENYANAGKSVEGIVSGVITKCLISPKVKTKELAQEIVLMFVEIEKQDAVTEELIKGLDNKTPKIVTACVVLIRQCIKEFGVRIIPVKPIVKVIPRLLEDRDKNVREEGKQLAVEIYRWIKEAIKPQLQGLKPIQLQELEAVFEKEKGEKPAPNRHIRSEQTRINENIDQGEQTDGNNEVKTRTEEVVIDSFDLLDPVDILSRLPNNFYDLCQAKKWSERKEVLESLLKLVEDNPKLQPGDYNDLIKELKRLISKDTNIVVVTVAIKCLGGIAKGLRKSFSPFATSSISLILEKFKEKKANVVQALREAIDATFLSTNLEAILEDLTAALDNKNPQIKAETALFLSRTFSKSHPTIVGNKKLLKPFCDSLLKTINDMDSGVRETSAEALGTIMKVIGEKALLPFLQGLEPIKFTKIKEYCDKAEVKIVFVPPVTSKQSAQPGVKKPTIASGPKQSSSTSSTVKKEEETTEPQKKPITKKSLAPKTTITKAPSATQLGASKKRLSVVPVPRPASSTSSLKSDSTEESETQKKVIPKKGLPSKTVSKQPLANQNKIQSKVNKTLGNGETTNLNNKLTNNRTVIRGKAPRQSIINSHKVNNNNNNNREKDVEEEEEQEYVQEEQDDSPMAEVEINDCYQTPQTNKMATNSGTITKMMINTSPSIDVALNLVIAQFSSQNINEALEALSQLSVVLEEGRSEVLEPKIDQITIMCYMQYKFFVTKHLTDEDLSKSEAVRLFKGVTNILSLIFKNSYLAKKITRDVLRELLSQIIALISDSKLIHLNDSGNIIRSLNNLANLIINFSDSTNVICALIKLLHDCIYLNSSPKFTEMVMKCLWKISRNLNLYIDNLDIDRIFLDVHNFLKAFPKKYFKDNNSSDIPLRTLKTLTFIIVQHKRESVFEHLTLIQDKEDSELFHYLEKALKQSDKMLEMKSYIKTHNDPLVLLDSIISKIGKGDDCQVFNELYEFTKYYPNIPIEPHLEKYSDVFKQMVIQGINKVRVEKENMKRANKVVIPKLVSVETLTPEACIQWYKQVGSMLKVDTSKFDDPKFIQQVNNRQMSDSEALEIAHKAQETLDTLKLHAFNKS